MSDTPVNDDHATLSPSEAERVDAVCDQVEKLWKTGQRPRLEDFLGQGSGSENASLLRELIKLDVYYRRLGGEQPREEDYLSRFAGLDRIWLAQLIPHPARGYASVARTVTTRCS
jgi:hypothetical protein